MKKYIRTIVVIAILTCLGLGYYYYLSNRTPSQDATDQAANNEEVSKLISRDIVNNYPDSPKEVIKLYVRITKAYYQTDLTEEQIEKLGGQARILFDDELKSTQTQDEFFTALKADIAAYRSAGMYLSDYQIDGSNNVKYTTWNNNKYSSLVTLYYIRQGSDLHYSYTKFTLRQDANGKWKILFWELVSQEEATD